jgi:hypothetical protein
MFINVSFDVFFAMIPKAYRNTRLALQCADGFTVSIQASSDHYCYPRNDTGPYETYEVGFPSSYEESLMPYAEDACNPTGTVYSGVPASVVVSILDKHAGVVRIASLRDLRD